MESQPAPRVSVVVRTKDRPRLLRAALESLRAQTFRDFEVLVVNDGGTPPEGLEPAGAGLRVVTTDPPHGRARALNTGLRAARGRFVAYLDDDDLWLPAHLETLERFLSGTDAYRAAYTSVRVVLQTLGEDGGYHDERTIATYGSPFVRERLLSSNTVPLIGFMHERALALEAGCFDEAFDLFEDWDFLIRLSERTRFHHLPAVTAVYRLRDDGSNATTADPWKSPRSDAARRQILAKHWHAHGPETQAALVDALTAEREEVRADRDGLARALAERDGRIGALEAELTQARRAAQEAEERARTAAEEALLVRADAARQLQASGERESALAAQAARVPGLERVVHDMQHSRVWRLFTPWWRLKSFLSR